MFNNTQKKVYYLPKEIILAFIAVKKKQLPFHHHKAYFSPL